MSTNTDKRHTMAREVTIKADENLPHHHTISVGSYLAQRLVEAGAKDYFAIPGDYILTLLDEMLKNQHLNFTGCCNELNAGYAADGYCRATGGIGVVFVTYMVGGLSIINAIAGAYSDDLPVLIISGGPNNRDMFEHNLIHHTIGEYDLYQQSKCFEPVVAKTFVIRHIKEVPALIDEAIVHCLMKRKPVYLEIACNLISQKVIEPCPRELDLFRRANISDNLALAGCLDDLKATLNKSTKPVLIGGVKLRVCECSQLFFDLAKKMGCGVALTPDAKSLFPEHNDQYMGIYWGSVSSPHCAEIVESADCYIFVGAIFNDYTTTGWSTLISADKLIYIGRDFVTVCNRRYSGVYMKDVLEMLVPTAPHRDNSLIGYRRYQNLHGPAPELPLSDNPLTNAEFRQQIQEMLTPTSNLLVETGDAWFMGQYFKLPDGAKYHVQMQYGSIGWSVGACLGVSLAVGDHRQVIALIGDGSFQMTAQELSTMIRRHVNITIFLLNNNGYTIEVQIHDNAYNDIQNWKYAELVNVFRNEGDSCMSCKVSTSKQLADVLKKCHSFKGVKFIEVILGRDDCTQVRHIHQLALPTLLNFITIIHRHCWNGVVALHLRTEESRYEKAIINIASKPVRS
jgi:pyruvate decarboxylase